MIYGFFLYFFLLLFPASPVPAPVADTPAPLYLSTDRGQHWRTFTEGLPAAVSITGILSQQNRVYLATNAHGFFTLGGNQSEWVSSNNGLPANANLTTIAGEGKHLVLGTYNKGVYFSQDGGKHWRTSIFNIPGNSIVGNPVNSLNYHGGFIYAGTENGIYRSWDSGMSWQKIHDQFFVYHLLSSGDRLYAASRDGLLASDDGGDSWRVVNSDHFMYRLYAAEGKLYAAVAGHGVLRSDDGGKTWLPPVAVMCGVRSGSLPDALWKGYVPALPSELPARFLEESALGWLAAGVMNVGC